MRSQDYDRIYLSPPHLGRHELNFVHKAIEDNWVAPTGPNITGFEADICAATGAAHGVALVSGTAALHLGLVLLGVGVGDEVLCSSFTFVATANPILYVGATPVFIDSEADTWNLCPGRLREAITARIKAGKKPKALMLVHLYGMAAKLTEIMAMAGVRHPGAGRCGRGAGLPLSGPGAGHVWRGGRLFLQWQQDSDHQRRRRFNYQ